MWSEFLQRLASVNPEFTYDDISDWSTTELEALTALGLLHEIERATHVFCDACPEAHWERVRWSEDGKRAFIPCPLVGTVDVDLERLRRWRGSPTQLSVLLAEALALSGEVRPLPTSRIWFLGRHRAAGRTPYFFFSAIGPDELPSAMQEIRQAYGHVTSVLLVPFSPPDFLGAGKLRIVDLCIISSLRIGGITVDFDSIEEQFTDDHVGPQGSKVKKASRSLATHRRAILKAFMKESSIDRMEALARSLRVSETALHGMIRGDRRRYSDDRLDSVLKKIRCPRAKWDGAANRAARA